MITGELVFTAAPVTHLVYEDEESFVLKDTNQLNEQFRDYFWTNVIQREPKTNAII